MSIYSTWLTIEKPIIYQGSHILPRAKDPRYGYLGVAAIPNHIEREYAGPGLHDFLRLSTFGKDVTYSPDSKGGYQKEIKEVELDLVLDRKQVEALRDTLTQWLESKERE